MSSKSKATSSGRTKGGKMKEEIEAVDEAGENDDYEGLQLPGQKYPAPPDGDGTRLFYESTYEQIPDDKMSQKWLLEHGLLPMSEITKILKSASK